MSGEGFPRVPSAVPSCDGARGNDSMGRRDIDRMLWAVGEARRLRLARASGPIQIALEPVAGVSPVTGDRERKPGADPTGSAVGRRSTNSTA
jgi:hypothetical protein